ncbi:hypothetical protein D3C85_1215990 [compost metagenome]
MQHFERRLLTYAGNARNIIGRIAHETLQIYNLIRCESVFFFNGFWIKTIHFTDPFASDSYGNVVRSKLEHILVA